MAKSTAQGNRERDRHDRRVSHHPFHGDQDHAEPHALHQEGAEVLGDPAPEREADKRPA